MTRHLVSALCMLLFAASAPAAVVFSGQQNVAIPFDLEGVYVNVFSNAVSYTLPTDFDNGPWLNAFYGGAGICTSPLIRPIVTGSVMMGSEQIANLSYGTVVNSMSRFSVGFDGYNGSETHVGPSISQFQLGTQGFIGYEFGPTLAGPKYYGVMYITIDNTGGAVIQEWRYESTPGLGIVVPEPSRISLLLVGLIGLASRRRRS